MAISQCKTWLQCLVCQSLHSSGAMGRSTTRIYRARCLHAMRASMATVTNRNVVLTCSIGTSQTSACIKLLPCTCWQISWQCTWAACCGTESVQHRLCHADAAWGCTMAAQVVCRSTSCHCRRRCCPVRRQQLRWFTSSTHSSVTLAEQAMSCRCSCLWQGNPAELQAHRPHI